MKTLKIFLLILCFFVGGATLVNADPGSGSVTVTVLANCTSTPWGTVASGYSNTAYSSSTVPYGSSCSSETRSCYDGSLSGSYAYTSCSVNPPASCTGTPWGTVANGYSNTAYLASSPAGACTSQTRTCTNGSLSGSYTATGCTAGCTGTPWGSVSSGYSNTAYSSSSVTYPSSCSSQTRTCSSGTMSGTYAYTSCSVNAVAPTVTTKSVSSITQTTATGGGNVTSNGGSVVTVSGCAWSTSVNPTYSGGGPVSGNIGQTTDGWAIGGPWTSGMTGLTPNTFYHVRAYATNSVGTAYGSDVTFTATTANLPPTVNAGFDRFITLPVSSTTIPGASSTDSDGSISGNAWTFRAGPGVTPTITDGSTLTPTFSNMTSAGVYTFRLTATDNQGLQNYDEMTVTVSPVIIPPDSAIVLFSANPSTIFKGRSSTLTWSSTNADLGCTGSQDIGSDFNTGNNASGSDLVTPIQTTRYTLTCSSSKPSSTSSNTITKVIILNIKEQ